ncbi:MAG: hypothetical protein MZU97_04625 [Bacillus subtilis]|nr:hypothetical protein [Bacillus subtilis]
MPNIQLTVVLMMAFAVLLSKTIFIPFVLAYVVVDNFAGIFLMGSIDPFIIAPMTIAWLILLYATHAFRKKPVVWLAVFGFVYGFVYGWIFIPAHMIRFGLRTFWPYLLADLPFELTMAIANVVSILLLLPIAGAVAWRPWRRKQRKREHSMSMLDVFQLDSAELGKNQDDSRVSIRCVVVDPSR